MEGETFELDSSGEVREYVRPGGVQGEIGFEFEFKVSKFGLYVEVEAVALLKLLKLLKLWSKLECEEEEEGPEAGLRFWAKFECGCEGEGKSYSLKLNGDEGAYGDQKRATLIVSVR